MTRGVEHIDTSDPTIIPARVNIHHLQLRDLLQPTGVKDKILFVSRLQVEQADFASPLKPPTTYCTLDFQPNCLTTGCGLLAAGGQHGELALRPLHSPSSGAPHLQLDSSHAERPPAPWLLRTPTGGSINNAITIQPDLNHPSSSCRFSSTSSGASTSPSKADVVDSSPSSEIYSPWARDQPSTSNIARPGLLFGDEEMESELSESVFEELAAAYGFDPSYVNRDSRWRRSSQPRITATTPSSSTTTTTSPDLAPIKVMVSNNDQSIKLYKLRPPKSHPGAGGRIESGLPGLSRNTTLHYSTAINHSSLSPDQRTLIAVGDTPEVFIHSVSRNGEYTKIATYTASSDACFSTTWSPDGSKFAVASQDGVVSVWDVRSSRRLAAVSTSQASAGSGAARVVKFSPCGRFLAFTEHRNYWGVADTVTFGETQRIAAPREVAAGISSGSAAGGANSGVDVAEGWVERRLAGEERFRMVTGGEEAIARDRERRSMIHATFMREWNRAINLVDRGADTTSDSSSVVAQPTLNPNPTTTPSFNRGSNYFPDHLVNASLNPRLTDLTSGTTTASLLSAALAAPTSSVGYRPSSYTTSYSVSTTGVEGQSINISGLCWDPEGEFVYVSTERVVAKYPVGESRVSVTHAGLL
ncbi:uncharacterized protein UTRI_05881_B [Ustilago trichophora]|uniref:DUF2415 domain-containing protein n=1 Tax=Ustilago trichophora TaxID=86804 RepID=A0A5C3EL95_9BASI|nr:uncharacterized protein UTRI_05881_B [Ustilago trichophora]